MKKTYILSILTILFLTEIKVNAQSTEDFESEVTTHTTFTDNGQSFTISSNRNGDSFLVGTFPNAGWNGTAIDQQFIESSPTDGDKDGTSFIISTTDGKDILIESLYFFLSTDFTENTTNSTLTIEGKKDGATVYSITKNSGFSNVETFSPNNGYTFINFSTEGGSDNSNTKVDQIVFTTTNDGDYVALDAFTWNTANLSTDDIEFDKTIRIYPNPSTEFIQVSGLSETESYLVYSVLGTEITSGIISNNEKIDIKNYSNGLYFLKLENGNTIKFIKE